MGIGFILDDTNLDSFVDPDDEKVVDPPSVETDDPVGYNSSLSKARLIGNSSDALNVVKGRLNAKLSR